VFVRNQIYWMGRKSSEAKKRLRLAKAAEILSLEAKQPLSKPEVTPTLSDLQIAILTDPYLSDKKKLQLLAILLS
jgi:hypothetical protein